MDDIDNFRVLGVVTTVIITASVSIEGRMSGDSLEDEVGLRGVGVIGFGCNSG